MSLPAVPESSAKSYFASGARAPSLQESCMIALHAVELCGSECIPRCLGAVARKPRTEHAAASRPLLCLKSARDFGSCICNIQALLKG